VAAAAAREAGGGRLGLGGRARFRCWAPSGLLGLGFRFFSFFLFHF
jgi:hypothetical protein